MIAKDSCSWLVKSGSRKTCLFGSSKVSYGHTAQKGTMTSQWSFSRIIRSFLASSRSMYFKSRGVPCFERYSFCALSSAEGSLGRKELAQIWQWGWGFEQPIISPLFSKIWKVKAAWNYLILTLLHLLGFVQRSVTQKLELNHSTFLSAYVSEIVELLSEFSTTKFRQH